MAVKWSYLSDWNMFICQLLASSDRGSQDVRLPTAARGRSETVAAWWIKYSFEMTQCLVSDFGISCSSSVVWSWDQPRARAKGSAGCSGSPDLGFGAEGPSCWPCPVPCATATPCPPQTAPAGTSLVGEEAHLCVSVTGRLLCPTF